jgi:hypothetical protein
MRMLTAGALVSAFIVSVVSLSGRDAAARNFNQAQRNVMEHFAQAFAGTGRCPRYTVNVKMVMLMGIGVRINIAQADVNQYVEERALVFRERFAQRTVDDICASLVRVYGPSGTGAANLVVPANS